MMAMENCFMAAGVVGGFHEPYSMDYCSPVSSPENSTGYLEDAVAEWGERCKRLRTASSPASSNEVAGTALVAEDVQDLLQLFWGSNFAGNIYGDFESLFHESSIFSDEKRFNNREEVTVKAAAKAQLEELLCSSPAVSCPENCKSAGFTDNFSSAKLGEEEEGRKTRRRRRKKKVVYPFTILKPAGIREDEVTLEEINERILMRPTRPVRHPVGEFACLPCVPDAGGGPGLSGKEVVGLTRIHTQGRGTVTIIRTRG
ncbi:hypothetical protein KSP39_PZI004634 [Platanthera zijinensis]|uniref:Protein XRI1 n=1 Tax=Platanthera zijinensis TaxID=2320716 RepID=A0AAP0GD79_9ASPA